MMRLASSIVVSLALLSSFPARAQAPQPCGKDCAHETAATPAPKTRGAPASAPSWGPASAPVTIEVWSDFQCPFCAKGAVTLKALEQRYGDQVRVVFRQLPLPFHEHAAYAAEAGLAASAQGKFLAFHDALFTHGGQVDRAAVDAAAQAAGLDLARFRAALEAGTYRDVVKADVEEANGLGIAGTPTFYVNGQPLVGARPLADFVEAVDAALAR